MKKKITLICAAYCLMLMIGMLSCEKIDDCEPFPDKYKVTSLQWRNYEAVHSAAAEPKLAFYEITNGSVDYSRYAIFVNPSVQTYYSMMLQPASFGLINAAYACSPIPPTTDDKIENITITSNQDFDAGHPAGTNLAEIFDIVVLDPENKLYHERYALEDFLATNPKVLKEMTLMLNSRPELEKEHEFTVKFYLDGVDLDYFEFTSGKILIRN